MRFLNLFHELNLKLLDMRSLFSKLNGDSMLLLVPVYFFMPEVLKVSTGQNVFIISDRTSFAYCYNLHIVTASVL